MNKHYITHIKYLKVLIFCLSIALVTSCGTTPTDYKNTTPEFDLKEFFIGELKGWGLIKDYQGKVTKRFVVDMTGTWENNKGVLYELLHIKMEAHKNVLGT